MLDVSIMHAVRPNLKDTDGLQISVTPFQGSGLRCMYHCSENMHYVCSVPILYFVIPLAPLHSCIFVLACMTLIRNVRGMDCHQRITVVLENKCVWIPYDVFRTVVDPLNAPCKVLIKALSSFSQGRKSLFLIKAVTMLLA